MPLNGSSRESVCNRIAGTDAQESHSANKYLRRVASRREYTRPVVIRFKLCYITSCSYTAVHTTCQGTDSSDGEVKWELVGD